MGKNKIYHGDIVAGSLLIAESRKVAELLLKKLSKDEFYQEVMVNNILQKKNPLTARRQAKLILNRLELMNEELWDLIVSGNKEVAVQALLAAAIKHSRLLGDFLDKVIREHVRTFNKQLSRRDWDVFLEQCARIDPGVQSWTESTQKKLGHVIFRILAEAKYIDSTRSLKLTPVYVIREVKEYLKKHNEKYVLTCMEVYL